MVKLTFVGDILCEQEQLRACKTIDGTYSFYEGFQGLKEYFSSSDYVIGNLETPLAGEELGYTNHMWSFNTPEEFALDLKKSGFHLVTTANNHCLDRGIEGLCNTIDVLDKYGIEHIGTYKDEEARNRVFIKEIGEIKIAFIAYTYGTNASFNKKYLKRKQGYYVNMFMPQEEHIRRRHIVKRALRKFKKVLIKDEVVNFTTKPYINQLKEDIRKARELGADYIIMCMHAGGQYNSEPESYTRKLAKYMIELGVDTVIGNHEHVVHNGEFISDKSFIAYCLGNFTCTPDSQCIKSARNIVKDDLYQYSIVLNLYLSKENEEVKIKKVTFSVAKSVIEEGNISKVRLVSDLIEECKDPKEKDKLILDNTTIVNRFLRQNYKNIHIQKEYDFKGSNYGN